MDTAVTFHQGPAPFEKSKGVQDQTIAQGSFFISVDCQKRQVIKEAFEYGDLGGPVIKESNVFGGAATLETLAPQLVPAGSVGKTNCGLLLAVQ